jgi:hypothetical protein
MSTRRPRLAPIAPSAFAGFCFPPDIIVLAVRWYLHIALSYRDAHRLETRPPPHSRPIPASGTGSASMVAAVGCGS